MIVLIQFRKRRGEGPVPKLTLVPFCYFFLWFLVFAWVMLFNEWLLLQLIIEFKYHPSLILSQFLMANKKCYLEVSRNFCICVRVKCLRFAVFDQANLHKLTENCVPKNQLDYMYCYLKSIGDIKVLGSLFKPWHC